MLWASQRSYFGSSCGYYYLFFIIIIVLLLLLLLLTYWPGCSANTCGFIPPQDLCTCCLLLLGKLFAPLHTWLARLILASAQVDSPESLPWPLSALAHLSSYISGGQSCLSVPHFCHCPLLAHVTFVCMYLHIIKTSEFNLAQAQNIDNNLPCPMNSFSIPSPTFPHLKWCISWTFPLH